jgi:LysR family transcriptional regulator, regulator for bpeEF and oprC
MGTTLSNTTRRFDLDLEAIHWFTLIAESKSFLPVARLLKIPKSTLSRRIAKLESQLGGRLFVRNAHSVVTTEFGGAFYPRAISILGSIEAGLEVSSRVQNEFEGPIRVVAGFEFGALILSPIVSKYAEKHPKVVFDVILNDSAPQGLLLEGFDLAIRVGPLKNTSLVSRKIGNINYGLFASPQYLAARGRLRSWKDLVKHDTLQFTGGHFSDGWKILDGKKKRVLHLSPKMRGNTHKILRDAAVQGLGVCFLPKFLVAEDVATDRLQAVLPKLKSWELPIHILFPERKFMPAKIRDFVEFLANEIESDSTHQLE